MELPSIIKKLQQNTTHVCFTNYQNEIFINQHAHICLSYFYSISKNTKLQKLISTVHNINYKTQTHHKYMYRGTKKVPGLIIKQL